MRKRQKVDNILGTFPAHTEVTSDVIGVLQPFTLFFKKNPLQALRCFTVAQQVSSQQRIDVAVQQGRTTVAVAHIQNMVWGVGGGCY